MNTRRLFFTVFAVLGMLLPQGMSLAAQPTNTVDVRIWTEDISGQPVNDVCYTLESYSNVGCDENGDGNVLFEDIPYGRYFVVASYPGGSNHRVAPFHIDVDANNTDFVAFAESRISTDPKPSLIQDVTDLFLITRDPKTGEALTGACYQLVDYSNVGCDENGDGRVAFADIPFSTYSIRQITAPAGCEKIDDYIVSIMAMDIDGPVSLLLVQAQTQAPKDHYNISVVFVDSQTNQLVMATENCAQLGETRNPLTLRGCDDGIVDGQVDFMNVGYDPEAGSDLNVALACPWEVVPGSEPRPLWVGQSSLFLYIDVVDSGEPCT